MALVLAVEVGRSFFVGNQEIKMERMIDPEKYVLRIIGKGDAMDNLVEINSVDKNELLPEVIVYAGPATGRPGLAKVVLEAPKNIRILRDNLFYNL